MKIRINTDVTFIWKSLMEGEVVDWSSYDLTLELMTPSHSKETLTPDSLGFLVDYAREYKKANQDTDYILFGHMHYPYDLSEDDLRVLFLGCWDNDEATYAAMDDAGNISLKTF